jgi:Arc/MetJ family transcription regulator
MARFHFSTKSDAVNFALRRIAAEALDQAEARAMRGSAWEGDLDEMRGGRVG